MCCCGVHIEIPITVCMIRWTRKKQVTSLVEAICRVFTISKYCTSSIEMAKSITFITRTDICEPSNSVTWIDICLTVLICAKQLRRTDYCIYWERVTQLKSRWISNIAPNFSLSTVGITTVVVSSISSVRCLSDSFIDFRGPIMVPCLAKLTWFGFGLTSSVVRAITCQGFSASIPDWRRTLTVFVKKIAVLWGVKKSGASAISYTQLQAFIKCFDSFTTNEKWVRLCCIHFCFTDTVLISLNVGSMVCVVCHFSSSIIHIKCHLIDRCCVTSNHLILVFAAINIHLWTIIGVPVVPASFMLMVTRIVASIWAYMALFAIPPRVNVIVTTKKLQPLLLSTKTLRRNVLQMQNNSNDEK